MKYRRVFQFVKEEFVDAIQWDGNLETALNFLSGVSEINSISLKGSDIEPTLHIGMKSDRGWAFYDEGIAGDYIVKIDSSVSIVPADRFNKLHTKAIVYPCDTITVPAMGFRVQDLIDHVLELLVESRTARNPLDGRAVNYGDFGEESVFDVQYITSLTNENAKPECVVFIQQAYHNPLLIGWLNEKLDKKQFPRVSISGLSSVDSATDYL